MSDGLRRESKATEAWPAWAGRTDRLARLAQTIEDSTARYRDQMLAEAEDRTRSGYDFLSPEELETRVEEVRSRTESEWKLQMTASRREFATKYSGDFVEVLAAIDPKTITSVELTWPNGLAYSSPSIAVRLSRDRGCRFEIQGDDPAWVRAAHGAISDDLKQGVPSWASFRRLPAAILASTLTWVAIVVAALNSGQESVATYSGISLGAFFFFYEWLFKRLLPGFEILTPEDKGKGGRVVAIVGTLLLGTLGSIIASLLIGG